MANNKQGLLDIPSTYLDIMKSGPKYKWFKPIFAACLGAKAQGYCGISCGSTGENNA